MTTSTAPPVTEPVRPDPAAVPSAGSAAGSPRRARRGDRDGVVPFRKALPWILPTLVLILGVAFYPVWEIIRTSTSEVSRQGLIKGPAGFENFRRLLDQPNLTSVLMNTLVWVVSVVVLTIAVSLPLAQFLSKPFPGRRLVRISLIVPWAAAVVNTSIIMKWMMDPASGVLNRLLRDLGVIDRPIDWLKDPSWAMPSLVFIAVFVSVPFTTYALLAGMQSIPDDVYEAAALDGATGVQAYRRITFPLLRPALIVATVINLINVFNSFPIIWVAGNKGGLNNAHDTMATYAYSLAFLFPRDLGLSAAMSLVNFSIVVVGVAFYLKQARWSEVYD